MTEIKTLQMRIEEKTLNDLQKDLAKAEFMLMHVTVGDLAKFCKDCEKKDGGSAEDITNTVKGIAESSGGYFGRLRNIMSARMFPARLDEQMKIVMANIKL